MKISLKQLVNASILLAFIGMFISFPFKESFIGGLLFALCSAATIGGLADSFAVSALFGQPLKLPWPRWMGTNIISRNRDRLINELVDMVEHELLSTEMIRKQLIDYKATDVLLGYLSSSEGKQAFKQLASQAITDVLKVSHPSVISLALKRLLNQGLEQVQPIELVQKILILLHQNQYDQAIIKQVAKQMKLFVEQEQVQSFILEFIKTAIRSYENNSKRRQFVNGIAGLNAEDITQKVLNIALRKLSAIEQGQDEWNEKLPQLLLDKVAEWNENEQLSELWNERLRKGARSAAAYIINERSIEAALQKVISLLDRIAHPQDSDPLDTWVENQFDQILSQLSSNHALLDRSNQMVVNALINLVESNHSYIGKLVRNKLEQFDEHQLIELVQEKAGKDLQYIRLNGTLVGALIGMVLYLIGFAAGGIMS